MRVCVDKELRAQARDGGEWTCWVGGVDKASVKQPGRQRELDLQRLFFVPSPEFAQNKKEYGWNSKKPPLLAA